MVPVATGAAVLPDHSIVVRDGLIHAIEARELARHNNPEAVRVDLTGQAVIPGLINAHTHAAMTLLRGFADDLVLTEWLEQRIWPAEAEHVSAEFVADGTSIACAEMLSGGTTAFNDMYFYAASAIQAATDAGIRIGCGLTYLNAPTSYAKTEDEYIDRGLDAVDTWQGTPLVTFAWAPHSTYAASPASWGRLAKLREDHPFPVHVHVQETATEVEHEVEAHGLTPIARIHRAGLLHGPFAGVHAVHLRGGDIPLLVEGNASVVHCPSSNMKLASGMSPVTQLLRADVNVGLGTDGAASNNRLDMWQEMRTAALLAKIQTGDPAALTAEQALTMATIGSARSMGIDEFTGSIEVGKAADLVAVDLSGVASQPVYDPISHLVYVAGRDDVTNVWVAGRRVLDNRKLVFIDIERVKAQAHQWHQRIKA